MNILPSKIWNCAVFEIWSWYKELICTVNAELARTKVRPWALCGDGENSLVKLACACANFPALWEECLPTHRVHICVCMMPRITEGIPWILLHKISLHAHECLRGPQQPTKGLPGDTCIYHIHNLYSGGSLFWMPISTAVQGDQIARCLVWFLLQTCRNDSCE